MAVSLKPNKSGQERVFNELAQGNPQALQNIIPKTLTPNISPFKGTTNVNIAPSGVKASSGKIYGQTQGGHITGPSGGTVTSFNPETKQYEVKGEGNKVVATAPTLKEASKKSFDYIFRNRPFAAKLHYDKEGSGFEIMKDEPLTMWRGESEPSVNRGASQQANIQKGQPYTVQAAPGFNLVEVPGKTKVTTYNEAGNVTDIMFEPSKSYTTQPSFLSVEEVGSLKEPGILSNVFKGFEATAEKSSFKNVSPIATEIRMGVMNVGLGITGMIETVANPVAWKGLSSDPNLLMTAAIGTATIGRESFKEMTQHPIRFGTEVMGSLAIGEVAGRIVSKPLGWAKQKATGVKPTFEYAETSLDIVKGKDIILKEGAVGTSEPLGRVSGVSLDKQGNILSSGESFFNLGKTTKGVTISKAGGQLSTTPFTSEPAIMPGGKVFDFGKAKLRYDLGTGSLFGEPSVVKPASAELTGVPKPSGKIFTTTPTSSKNVISYGTTPKTESLSFTAPEGRTITQKVGNINFISDRMPMMKGITLGRETGMFGRRFVTISRMTDIGGAGQELFASSSGRKTPSFTSKGLPSFSGESNTFPSMQMLGGFPKVEQKTESKVLESEAQEETQIYATPQRIGQQTFQRQATRQQMFSGLMNAAAQRRGQSQGLISTQLLGQGSITGQQTFQRQQQKQIQKTGQLTTQITGQSFYTPAPTILKPPFTTRMPIMPFKLGEERKRDMLGFVRPVRKYNYFPGFIERTMDLHGKVPKAVLESRQSAVGYRPIPTNYMRKSRHGSRRDRKRNRQEQEFWAGKKKKPFFEGLGELRF